MEDIANFQDDDRNDDIEVDDDALDFDLNLVSTEHQSGFRTKNDPLDPLQRSNIVQRKGPVDVKCTCVDVIHGHWGSTEPDTQATLVVILFRFDSRKQARRIISVNAELAFFDSQGRHRKNPEVAIISLDGNFSLTPTQQTKSTAIGSEGAVGGGILGAEISGKFTWEHRGEWETTDAAQIVGSIDRLGAPAGPSNAANWTLQENPLTKKGVPAAIRVGILIKRRAIDDDFFCTVKLETEVDMKTRLERLFGSREQDDPILFRTSKPPTNRLMEYDTKNLGAIDMSLVEDVTATTVLKDVVKER
ncbi:hypothetical protein EsH8_V_001050 [Colletotrichum jinshuiense]